MCLLLFISNLYLQNKQVHLFFAYIFAVMSIIPNHKCSHSENRLKVCAPCGKKIICGSKNLSTFSINEKQEKLIKDLLNIGYDKSDSRFPLSIRGCCRLTLYEHEKKNFKRPLPIIPNYDVIVIPKITRSDKGMICNCYVCLEARRTNHHKVEKGRGKTRKMNPKINIGLFGASNIQQVPRHFESPVKSNSSTHSSLQIC